jgi:predicted  nucleic acid-binding Zn-ribbon protein
VHTALEQIDNNHEVNCLNCGHFTGDASECPHCGAILFNEDDPENLQEDSGDLSEFDDEV